MFSIIAGTAMRFKGILRRHWLLTFAIMCISAMMVGICSVNLFYLLRANFELISRTGTLLLFDGALEQLLELLTTGIVTGSFYVLFKACEKVLVEKLLQ